MGLISRLWLLYTIPWRLFTEIFQCYVWRPKANTVSTTSRSTATNGNGHAAKNNGHSSSISEDNHNGHIADPSRLQGDKLKQLEQHLDMWWGPTTPLQGLQRMNRVRVPIIVEAYISNVLKRPFSPDDLSKHRPLEGAAICDVGCGGGFLSEALVDAGAEVTGVDLNEMDLLAAKRHWQQTRSESEPAPHYRHIQDIAQFSQDHLEEYDVVVCSELLEHVDEPMEFLKECCRMVRPGGCIVVTTNNRTLSALAFALIWLEHIAAIIPQHTHSLHKFIKPQEIDTLVRQHGFQTVNLAGYLPLGLTATFKYKLQWVLTSFTGVWYAAVAVKQQ